MTNRAAYLPGIKQPLEVGPATFPTPEKNEVLVRNYAIAINPLDIGQQEIGFGVHKWPHIPGVDIAGVVEAIGENVTNVKKGDRVAAMCIHIRSQKSANAGFQLYSTTPSRIVALVPDDLDFNSAAVFPLALATSSSALFEPIHLGLTAPSFSNEPIPNAKGKAILIWGGASVVGSVAIQLAAAAGVSILTTASTKNHEYVKALGADYVIDYKDEKVVQKLTEAANGKDVLGVYETVSNREIATKCAEFLHHFGGGLVFATRPDEFGDETTLLGDVRRLAGHPPGVGPNGEVPVWFGVFQGFFQGLKVGKFRAEPKPVVIKGGLTKCQEAIDLYRKGVSASKIVVELSA